MAGPRSVCALRTALPRAVASAPIASSSRRSVTAAVRCASTFTPSGGRDASELRRPPRPANPSFFTAKPEVTETLLGLHATREAAEAALRAQFVWPIPAGMPHLQPPPTAWKTEEGMNMQFRANRDYDNIIGVLGKLHAMRHVATVAGVHDVAAKISKAVAPYERPERVAELAARAAARAARADEGHGIDDFGRAYALGRRKSSSARVWVVPSPAGRELLDAEAKTPGQLASEAETAESETPTPQSEILINHLPLPTHFGKVADRETILRPLRITGLLGAFNVFALARGGGTTGQSGAIANALARAVSVLRPETRDVLYNDGALKRDIRVVERKKTGRAKARKRYTWVKR